MNCQFHRAFTELSPYKHQATDELSPKNTENPVLFNLLRFPAQFSPGESRGGLEKADPEREMCWLLSWLWPRSLGDLSLRFSLKFVAKWNETWVLLFSLLPWMNWFIDPGWKRQKISPWTEARAEKKYPPYTQFQLVFTSRFYSTVHL